MGVPQSQAKLFIINRKTNGLGYSTHILGTPPYSELCSMYCGKSDNKPASIFTILQSRHQQKNILKLASKWDSSCYPDI